MKAVISCKCNVTNLTHIWRRFVVANAILDNIINVTSKICYQNNHKNDAVIAIFFQVNIFSGFFWLMLWVVIFIASLRSYLMEQGSIWHGELWQVSPSLFWEPKKCPNLWGNIFWFLIWVFKSIKDGKHQFFSLRGLSSMCCRWNAYWSALIPRNLLFPQKFLVASLWRIFKISKNCIRP